MATFDFSTGTLTIDASTSLFHGRPSPDELPLTGATELAKYGEWENYGIKSVKVWGKTFGVTARYCNKKLAMVDFVWVDGVAKKIDWSATEDDLVKGKEDIVENDRVGSASALFVFYDWRGYVCLQLGNAYGARRPALDDRNAERCIHGIGEIAGQ